MLSCPILSECTGSGSFSTPFPENIAEVYQNNYLGNMCHLLTRLHQLCSHIHLHAVSRSRISHQEQLVVLGCKGREAKIHFVKCFQRPSLKLRINIILEHSVNVFISEKKSYTRPSHIFAFLFNIILPGIYEYNLCPFL